MKKIIKENAGKLAGVGGGGSIGLAAIYFVVTPFFENLPTKQDLNAMELRMTREVHAMEERINSKLFNLQGIHGTDRNVNEWSNRRLRELFDNLEK